MSSVGKGITIDIMECLSVDHGNQDGWLYYHEFRLNSGFSQVASTIDGFALNRYGSKNFQTRSYEIKTSRGDFLSEMKKPKKQERAKRFSNLFYYVVPSLDVAKPEEVPSWAGLLLYLGDSSKNKEYALYRSFEQVKVAPKLNRDLVDWNLAAALAYQKVSYATISNCTDKKEW